MHEDTYESARRAIVEDPIWETTSGESNENALLHLCDSRYGWLHYAIPRDEAYKLGGFLRAE